MRFVSYRLLNKLYPRVNTRVKARTDCSARAARSSTWPLRSQVAGTGVTGAEARPRTEQPPCPQGRPRSGVGGWREPGLAAGELRVLLLWNVWNYKLSLMSQ